MSLDGFVGLDPDAARGIADVAGAAGETADQIASDVAGVLSAGQVPDNGFAGLCAEVSEELGLLQQFLEAKATEMELAASGMYVDVSGAALGALWASLTDDVGAGVDFDDEPWDEEATVTMSSSVAAAMLAQWLAWQGEDAEVGLYDLQDLVDDEGLPPEVRAAAQYFALHGELWSEVAWGTMGPARAEDFERFVVTNAALAVFGRSYDRFDVAGQDAGTDPDGRVSFEDVEIVANDTSGRFTDEEREAAQWFLDGAALGLFWESRQTLTYMLYTRRIFSEDPELAVDYLHRAVEDPDAFVGDYTWYESEGGREWLAAAVSSTFDPQRQARILLDFAAVYQATMPEPVALLDVVHGLLDVVSFVDPFQVADAVNAGIYVLEGDNVNAAIAAGGILLPLGGGAAIRLGKEAILGLAAREGDEFVEAALRQAIRAGDLTDDVVDDIVREVGDQFGDDVARQVREQLDDLRRAADLDTGPGVWTTKNESMSPRAADFQASVTGAPPGTVYRLDGVDFDGYSGGYLIDAKGPGYATFVGSDGSWKPFFTGQDDLLDQAQRQVRAADGAPIRWVVAEPEAATAMRRMLAEAGLDDAIEVVG